MSRRVKAARPAASRGRAAGRGGEAALQVFSTTSYFGATTAEIARAAGISEPILYRHFASKRDLWLACLDTAWADVRSIWRRRSTCSPRPPMARCRSPWGSPRLPNLWLQGLAGAGDDLRVRRALRRHMREVHAAWPAQSARAVGRPDPGRPEHRCGSVDLRRGGLLSVSDRVGGVYQRAISPRSAVSAAVGSPAGSRPRPTGLPGHPQEPEHDQPERDRDPRFAVRQARARRRRQRPAGSRLRRLPP